MDLPRKILIVDDDEDSIKAIRSQLLMYDFEVDDLVDPTRVVSHLRATNNYGLFIIDVNMPGKDGITLAKQIRSSLKLNTPILFVSGDIRKETADRIRRLKLSGHVEFLKKGEFDSKELFSECHAMLKEYANATTMRELTGRVSHLQENFGEGMSKITEFIGRFQSQPLVTQASCDEKAKALIKEVRKEVIGITLGETNKKLDEAFKPETLAMKIGAALKSEHIEQSLDAEGAFKKVRSASSWKIAIYFLLVIFGGLCIFWGNMWIKAEGANTGMQELRIKHDQTISTIRAQTVQIRALLSRSPTRISSHL